ncbi:hypothetical protein Ahia01_000737100, partial [Argonauta hians]
MSSLKNNETNNNNNNNNSSNNMEELTKNNNDNNNINNNINNKGHYLFSSSGGSASLFSFPTPGNTLPYDNTGLSDNLTHQPDTTVGQFQSIGCEEEKDKDRLLSEIDGNTAMKSLNTILLSNSNSDYSNPSLIDLTSRELELNQFNKNCDDHKLQRSKSEDHTFMRPQNRSEEVPYRPRSQNEDPVTTRWRNTPEEQPKAEGAGIFRNPNLGTSPVRTKRKHRPAPLIIPPYVSNSGFQSRLRSPRVRDGNEVRTLSPPPYTPPPMLSPVRSGPGLFCNIQTRPVSPRLSSNLSARLPILNRRTSIGTPSQETPVSDDSTETEAPPETDILPHVNVGSNYQAELPHFSSNRFEVSLVESKEDLLWDPSILKDKNEEDVKCYHHLASSSAVRGNGSNVEYAMHLLFIAKGDIQSALIMLLGDAPKLPMNHPLMSFTYQENDGWTTEEIEAYNAALMKCDKDFFNIAKVVKSKSVKQCIQFYYLWKKVCPEEYKRLRSIRRKKESESIYRLRNQQHEESTTEIPEFKSNVKET